MKDSLFLASSITHILCSRHSWLLLEQDFYGRCTSHRSLFSCMPLEGYSKGCTNAAKHHHWGPASGLSQWWVCGRSATVSQFAQSIFRKLWLTLVEREACAVIQNILASISVVGGSSRNMQTAIYALTVTVSALENKNKQTKKDFFKKHKSDF